MYIHATPKKKQKKIFFIKFSKIKKLGQKYVTGNHL